MKLMFRLVIFSLSVAMIFVAAAKAQSPDGITLDGLTTNKITGAWQVNYAESDNPLAKIQSLLESTSGASSKDTIADAENSDAPPISVSLVPPETLILAGDDEKSITINEGYSQTVLTRTFATDGKTHSGELRNGAAFSFTAAQNAKSLKVETISPRGNKMTETYAIADEGKKLMVTVCFETAQAKEIMTLHRVYDRATPDTFSDDVLPSY